MESPDYSLKLKNNSKRGQQIYSFKSADGVESKNSFRDSEILISDQVVIEDSSLLVAESNYGFLGTVLGDKNSGQTTLTETSNRAAQLCRKNLEINNVDARVIEKAFYSEIDSTFDKAVYAPKSYEPVQLVKHRAGEIIELLKSGGELFIAGENKSGIKRYASFLKDLEGEVEKVEQRGSTRLYKYQRPSKVEVPEIKLENKFESEIDGEKINFKTCKGLFSYKSLDDASRLLIENVDIDSDFEVLDLCCGYGAIGIWLNKLHGCNISFTDDSNLATHYAEKNLDKAGLEAPAVTSDCLDGIEGKFDVIVSNPPTHQGSGITDELFRESINHLRNDGELYIVYNQNMNFERQLAKQFNRTETVVEKDNFKVLKATK